MAADRSLESQIAESKCAVRVVLMAWIGVGQASDIPTGEMKCFNVDDMDITVYHLEDGWYATADTCTHADCSLAEGEIDGNEIICWCHGGAFDIRSGKATRMPCVYPVETFQVRVQDGQIEVDFE